MKRLAEMTVQEQRDYWRTRARQHEAISRALLEVFTEALTRAEQKRHSIMRDGDVTTPSGARPEAQQGSRNG